MDRLERALSRLLPPFEPGLRGKDSQEEVGLCRSGRGGWGGAVQARGNFDLFTCGVIALVFLIKESLWMSYAIFLLNQRLKILS